MQHTARMLASFAAGALLVAAPCAAAPRAAAGSHGSPAAHRRLGRQARTLPKHVVIIVQENRSVDNLFQGFPGAMTQNFGLNSQNQQVPLTQVPLAAPYDPRHEHQDFLTEYNGGKLNGFDQERCAGKCPPDYAYSYVAQQQIQPYWTLAQTYGLADAVLQPNQGPSFPAHLYLIAGQSGIGEDSGYYVSDNSPKTGSGRVTCVARRKTTVPTIDMTQPFPSRPGPDVFPCIDPATIFDELDLAGIEWRYYAPSRGSLWSAPMAIKHLFTNPADYARVIVPSKKVLADILHHRLAPVSYVTPSSVNSDHPGKDNTGGPAWVASIVNAIGSDNHYWPNTAIIVVWDDWGGWYDHYPPANPINFWGGTPDPYEYGFRVPLLTIGMTARAGFIDHTPRTSAAILHFIEDVYGLPSLNRVDAQTDDLFDMFDFSSAYHRFKPIATGNVTIRSLLREPETNWTEPE